jgi:hypothetical protein
LAAVDVPQPPFENLQEAIDRFVYAMKVCNSYFFLKLYYRLIFMNHWITLLIYQKLRVLLG